MFFRKSISRQLPKCSAAPAQTSGRALNLIMAFPGKILVIWSRTVQNNFLKLCQDEVIISTASAVLPKTDI